MINMDFSFMPKDLVIFPILEGKYLDTVIHATLFSVLENGAGVNFSGVDIEDITSPVTEAGKLITNYDTDYANFAGSAFNVINVFDFNFIQSYVYELNTQTVFKFVGRIGEANIQDTNMEDGSGIFQVIINIQLMLPSQILELMM